MLVKTKVNGNFTGYCSYSKNRGGNVKHMQLQAEIRFIKKIRRLDQTQSIKCTLNAIINANAQSFWQTFNEKNTFCMAVKEKQ